MKRFISLIVALCCVALANAQQTVSKVVLQKETKWTKKFSYQLDGMFSGDIGSVTATIMLHNQILGHIPFLLSMSPQEALAHVQELRKFVDEDKSTTHTQVGGKEFEITKEGDIHLKWREATTGTAFLFTFEVEKDHYRFTADSTLPDGSGVTDNCYMSADDIKKFAQDLEEAVKNLVKIAAGH
jgi:hypothetical protein